MTVSIVGLVGGECFGPAARRALEEAGVVVGATRHLEAVRLGPSVERIELAGPLAAVLDTITTREAAGEQVCVLASGDPGFFGIVRVLRERFGGESLTVHPAPSSVSLAFARLGMSWDDAAVVSAHGRPLDEAVAQAVAGAKVAVLTSPDNPPEAVGAALVAAGCGPRQVAVVSRIGEEDESITRTDLTGLAAGSFDPMSVVVLTASDPAGGGVGAAAGLRWGLPEEEFEYRNRMITKSEVRAVALGKLALPPAGVLWDVGAGSGSVAIECARLKPGLRVFAVERSAEDARRIEKNAAAHRAAIEVVEGEAPAALASLPDPDRAFVGGGGLGVLEAVLDRLRPGGVIVATYALVDRAAPAAGLLGNMVQIAVSRAVPTGEAGVRLSAENPVFLCWGPAA